MASDKLNISKLFNEVKSKTKSQSKRKFKTYRPVYYKLDKVIKAKKILINSEEEDNIKLLDILTKPQFKLKESIKQDDSTYGDEINKILHTIGNEGTPTTLGLLNRSFNKSISIPNSDSNSNSNLQLSLEDLKEIQ